MTRDGVKFVKLQVDSFRFENFSSKKNKKTKKIIFERFKDLTKNSDRYFWFKNFSSKKNKKMKKIIFEIF